MMYIYVNDRINIVNSELNSPRISEGDLIKSKFGIINNAWNVNSNGNFNNNYDNDNEAGVRLDYFDTLL